MIVTATETLYRVRRGGYKLPVGTTLTAAEFTAIRNHKQLLATGFFVAVLPNKEIQR